MKDWHKLKPELFKKRPYYLPGCDTISIPDVTFIRRPLARSQISLSSNAGLHRSGPAGWGRLR